MKRLRNLTLGRDINMTKEVKERLADKINELHKQFPEVSFAKLSRIAVRVANFIEDEMMKNTIDGVAVFDWASEKTYGHIEHEPFCLTDMGLLTDDRVKLAILKEE